MAARIEDERLIGVRLSCRPEYSDLTGVGYIRDDCSRPDRIIIDALTKRGLPIEICHPKDCPDYLELFSPPETMAVINRIVNSPEYCALWQAWQHSHRKRPNLDDCLEWSEEVKRQVEAFYEENCAATSHRLARGYSRFELLISSEKRAERTSLEESAAKHWDKAEELLGDLPSLNTESLHALCEDIVEKVLTS
jgi:hypothetical protein